LHTRFEQKIHRLYYESHSLQDIRTIGVGNNTYIMMTIYLYTLYIYTVRKRKSRTIIVGFRYRGRNYTVRGKCTRARIIRTITTLSIIEKNMTIAFHPKSLQLQTTVFAP